MGKIVQNKISYSGVSARNYVDLIDILPAGSTQLTMESASLKEDSTVNLFTNNFRVCPTDAVLFDGAIVLTFLAQSFDVEVKVRVWDVRGGVGPHYDDGNNIYYPVANPLQSNKLYKESDVSAIAYALGESLTVSEMAGAVKTIVEASGLTTYKGTLSVLLAESSIVEYEER